MSNFATNETYILSLNALIWVACTSSGIVMTVGHCQDFGLQQAGRYERGPHRTISIVAENPHIAAERTEKEPPVGIYHHAKHQIVYLIEADHILVARVLRDEVDLTQHLQRAPYGFGSG